MTAPLENKTFNQLHLSPLIDKVDRDRTASWQSAFKGIPEVSLVINTGKEAKAAAILTLIKEHTGIVLTLMKEAFLYQDDQYEISHSDALTVAQWKAVQPRRNPNGIQGEFSKDVEVVTAGSDVNAFMYNGDRIQQQHKYERTKHQFTDVKLESTLKELMDQYCFPNSGEVRVVWDLGTHIINGVDHQFGDQIEVVSKPVNPALMKQYITQALQNGLFWSSNQHFAAMECLIENGGVTSVSFLPKELRHNGIDFKRMRQTPTPGLLHQALHSIVTNTPLKYS